MSAKQRTGPGGTVIGLGRSDIRPHLGDIGVLHDLVTAVADSAIGGMMALSRDEVSQDDLRRRDALGARRLARILLGREPGFAPVPGWNQPGGIDAAVAARLRLGDHDAEERLVTALRGLQLDAKLAAYMAIKGADEAEWRGLIQDTITSLVEIFLPGEAPGGARRA